MTYNSLECTDELEKEGYICRDGKISFGISVNSLTIEWLDENTECKYAYNKERNEVIYFNENISIKETKKDWTCQKWSLGNYTIVKN